MYISARVVAGAKKEEVSEPKPGRLSIFVKEPAKQNLANRRVLAVVAKHCGVPVAKVRLINGHNSPAKLFSVDI